MSLILPGNSSILDALYLILFPEFSEKISSLKYHLYQIKVVIYITKFSSPKKKDLWLAEWHMAGREGEKRETECFPPAGLLPK